MTDTKIMSHLPVLTWNQLKMNYGTIDPAGSVLKCNTDIPTSFGKLPDGVSNRIINAAEAKDILAKIPAETKERIVSSKQPIYHPQKFATGLGMEFDDLAMKEGGDIHLLEVGAGIEVGTPILWHFEFHDGNRAVSQQIIHVCEGASLTLIMDYTSEAGASGLSGISTKVILDRGAELDLSKVQMLGRGFVHMDDLGVSFDDGAVFKLNQMELGGSHTFAGVQCEMTGAKSVFTGKTAYLSCGNEKMDITYNAVQRGRKTKCNMSFDGVLTGNAEKTFRGTIDFRNGSAGSVGDEQENVLLLSEDIVNKTIPLILCEEEDVEGRHGATIGRLPADMLFYMETRGVDEKTAREIMASARLGAVTREIPDDDLRKRIHAFTDSRF
ncbi:MAG: SufD family Fe-S cluster assembly protein [Lachnospiraceae bacterium]|jgi:Fe-S cluster assembly scaffold protein SufB|nr:SufD family Fe-S cluster assembly protein [Lachnospiraceae bacterium]MDD4524372.1 SufD family Fe-S cluster assembly protein [Lachnospiraceae bacterium]